MKLHSQKAFSKNLFKSISRQFFFISVYKIFSIQGKKKKPEGKLTGPSSPFLFQIIYSCCEAKDSKKSKGNHYTSQEPNGEKTRQAISVMRGGGKPHINNPGKTHAVG